MTRAPLPVEATTYATTIKHARRTPIERTFDAPLAAPGWSTSTTCPTTARSARFEARDHLGDPDAHDQGQRRALPRPQRRGPDGGRIVMAANARALGYCFNPITVFWCHRRNGELAGVVVEVHNTYGDRHAYLVHPDEQGRARTEKQMYVSPVPRHRRLLRARRPRPGERLHVAVTLHSDDGAVFTASLDGERTTASPLRIRPRRAARHRAHPRPRRLAVGTPSRDPHASRPPTTGRRLT